VSALLWVYATPIDSALLAYEIVFPLLSNSEREAYYAESKNMAALFGIPPTALPANWPAFEGYMRSMLASDMLRVGSLGRELAQRILHGRGSWVPVPHWYRALTTASMPERFRDEFSMAFGKPQNLAAAKARVWLPKIYRRLPEALRFVGPYRKRRAA